MDTPEQNPAGLSPAELRRAQKSRTRAEKAANKILQERERTAAKVAERIAAEDRKVQEQEQRRLDALRVEEERAVAAAETLRVQAQEEARRAQEEAATTLRLAQEEEERAAEAERSRLAQIEDDARQEALRVEQARLDQLEEERLQAKKERAEAEAQEKAVAWAALLDEAYEEASERHAAQEAQRLEDERKEAEALAQLVEDAHVEALEENQWRTLLDEAYADHETFQEVEAQRRAALEAEVMLTIQMAVAYEKAVEEDQWRTLLNEAHEDHETFQEVEARRLVEQEQVVVYEGGVAADVEEKADVATEDTSSVESTSVQQDEDQGAHPAETLADPSTEEEAQGDPDAESKDQMLAGWDDAILEDQWRDLLSEAYEEESQRQAETLSRPEVATEEMALAWQEAREQGLLQQEENYASYDTTEVAPRDVQQMSTATTYNFVEAKRESLRSQSTQDVTFDELVSGAQDAPEGPADAESTPRRTWFVRRSQGRTRRPVGTSKVEVATTQRYVASEDSVAHASTIEQEPSSADEVRSSEADDLETSVSVEPQHLEGVVLGPDDGLAEELSGSQYDWVENDAEKEARPGHSAATTAPATPGVTHPEPEVVEDTLGVAENAEPPAIVPPPIRWSFDKSEPTKEEAAEEKASVEAELEAFEAAQAVEREEAERELERQAEEERLQEQWRIQEEERNAAETLRLAKEQAEREAIFREREERLERERAAAAAKEAARAAREQEKAAKARRRQEAKDARQARRQEARDAKAQVKAEKEQAKEAERLRKRTEAQRAKEAKEEADRLKREEAQREQAQRRHQEQQEKLRAQEEAAIKKEEDQLKRAEARLEKERRHQEQVEARASAQAAAKVKQAKAEEDRLARKAMQMGLIQADDTPAEQERPTYTWDVESGYNYEPEGHATVTDPDTAFRPVVDVDYRKYDLPEDLPSRF